MLGGLKRRKPWSWLAAGKHPVAMDFFEVGGGSALSRAFAGWIERGYRRWAEGSPPAGGMHAWRFWARGVERDELAVGIGRDSSDRSGRRYPLLIMGTGTLPGWERHWDLLPRALDECWLRLESIAARRYDDVKQLASRLQGLRRPPGNWADLKGNGLAQAPGNDDYQTAADQLQTRQFLCVPLQGRQAQGALPEAAQWVHAMKNRLPHPPGAVFLGGTPERAFLVMFTAALRPDDFVRLWSAAADR